MRRRYFLGGLAGFFATWPLRALAQGKPSHRIAVLMATADDEEGRRRLSAFVQGLQKLGWTEGRNLTIDLRWAGSDPANIRRLAAELIKLGPEVIATNSAQSTSIIKELTITTPIVFANVPDPVAAKIVDTLSRPRGNATGFSSFDVELSGKWLELLRELAPTVRRIGVNYYPVNPMWQPRLALLKAEAAKAGVGIETIPTSTPADIRTHFKSFAQGADGAIIVLPSVFTLAYSGGLIAAAQDNHLPAIYPYTSFVRRGGLLAYGPDQFDTFSRAAGYVDRILNGASTADLPVQRPTKFELLVNLNSAKALGLTVPPMLLGRADEVIE